MALVLALAYAELKIGAVTRPEGEVVSGAAAAPDEDTCLDALRARGTNIRPTV